MDSIEYHNKIKETVSKFENGEERFRKSAMFNKVVQMLVRDADPIKIIDQLINTSDDITKALEYHLRTGHIYKPLNHE